jgi:hypothetical protein
MSNTIRVSTHSAGFSVNENRFSSTSHSTCPRHCVGDPDPAVVHVLVRVVPLAPRARRLADDAFRPPPADVEHGGEHLLRRAVEVEADRESLGVHGWSYLQSFGCSK